MGFPCHYVFCLKHLLLRPCSYVTLSLKTCYSVLKTCYSCLCSYVTLSLITCYYVFKDLLLRYKKNLGILEKGFLSDEVLRVQDSNMRPPGYEPGELPTAPTRDINQR